MMAALIVAGGRGRRMAARRPKQFLPLGTRPILAHTLAIFQACDIFERIYLVVPRDHWDLCREQVLTHLGPRPAVQLIPGGRERQESVFNALKAMPETTEWVAVHDGVRPLVTSRDIVACLAKAQEMGAACLARPVAETLKKVSVQGLITATIPREQVWCAQTPQVFRFPWLWQAHRRARQENFTVTDDAQLMEWTGRSVAVVPASSENIKITTPEDLQLAEAILRKRNNAMVIDDC